MRNVIKTLTKLIDPHRSKSETGAARKSGDLHVVMPDSVDMPLPRAPREEICVPASINGRDLSTGRL